MKTRKNISSEKVRKSFFNSESAGATIVAAVLLLSIIFTVLAVVRIEYVPMWKTDAEQSHMSEVQKDMAELKSTADMVSLFTSSDSNTSAHGFPVTVSFSMGGGEIPILEPSKSSGTLSLNTERCRMIITPQRSSISNSTEIVDCGGVTYYSNNREYLDQIFRYENGALILSQKDRSLMRQSPSFKIERTTGDNYTVSIHAIRIAGDPDSISSNTDASLRLTGLYTEPVYDSNDSEGIDSFTCTILTQYPDAWVSYFNETAKNAGLEYDMDYAIDKIGSDIVCISFLDSSSKNLERLYVSKSVIQAELEAGGSLEVKEASDSESEENGIEDKSVMEMDKWYNFNKISDNGANSGVDLLSFKDYGTGFSFPTNDPYDSVLNPYSKDNNVFLHDQPYTLNLTFGFNDYTEFESQPTSATIRMIYHYTFSNTNPGTIQISGKSFDSLTGPKNTDWCLYNKTTSINITEPSNLTLNLRLNHQNPKYIEIDYLAVRLN
jgi:hypothetical protein